VAATPSVQIKVSSPYKGGTRIWSNRYHFNGGTPADATHWNTLFDAVTAAQKLVFDSQHTIVEAIGYAAGSDVPVATKVYSLAGTYSPAGTDAAIPLQCAALIRWSTAARSVKNHPIYLYTYMHGALIHGGITSDDTLAAAQKTALGTYATAWITGFSDGTITAVRASPNGAAATGQIVEEYITHRDFPYQSSV
jgi:hypothetical protein